MSEKVMYLGPNRPFDLPLATRAVLNGAPEQVFPQAEPFLAAHPDLRKLFIPILSIPAAKAQLALEGSPLYTAYHNIRAAHDAWRAARGE